MRVRAKHALNNCTSHVAPRASSSPHSSLPPPPHLRPSCAPTSHLSTLPSVQCTAATPRIACAAPRYAAHASLQARCHQTRNPALHATTRTRPRQSCGGVPQLRGLTLRMQAARAQTHRVTATRRPRDAHVTRAHLRMQPSSPAPRHSVGVSVSCKCCTCAVPSILPRDNQAAHHTALGRQRTPTAGEATARNRAVGWQAWRALWQKGGRARALFPPTPTSPPAQLGTLFTCRRRRRWAC